MKSYEGLELSDDQRLIDVVRKITVEPLSLTQRGIEIFNHHRKVAAGIGGVALGAIGFGAGAIHARHSH